MSSEKFKKMEITSGLAWNDSNHLPVNTNCSFPGCNQRSRFHIRCGNKEYFACKDHLDEVQTIVNNDNDAVVDSRVFTQGGPLTLNTRKFDIPAF